LTGKKKQAPRVDAEDARDLEVSPAFRKRPSRKVVIRGGPPDIPRNVIPVLRKPPIVIVHKRRRIPDAPPRPAAPAPATSQPLASGTRRAMREERIPADRDWKPPTTLRRQLAAPPAKAAPAPKRRPVPKTVSSPATRTPAITPRSAPAAAEESFAPSRAAPISLERPFTATHPLRERGLTRSGLLGVATLVVGLVAIVLYAATPWVSVTGDAPVGPSPFTDLDSGAKGARDLSDTADQSNYFGRLLNWPLAALIWSCLLGLALIVLDELPHVRVDHHRRIQSALLGVLLFLGFVEMVAGTRWIGLYVATLIDDGPSPAHLVLFPYVTLLLGLAQTFVVATLFRRKTGNVFAGLRIPQWTAVATAATILLLPVVPLGSLETDDGTAFIQEGELEGAPVDDPDLARAAAHGHFARGLLWLVFYMAVGATILGALARQNPRPLYHALFIFLQGAILPVALSALVAAILSQSAFARVDGARTFLAVLFGGLCAIIALYVVFVREDLVPYVRRLPTLPE
jgi:hypothetical protein